MWRQVDILAKWKWCARAPLVNRIGGSELNLDFLVGLPLEMRGPSYTAVRVAQAMQAAGQNVSIYSPTNRWPETDIDCDVVTADATLEPLIKRIPFRLTRPFIQKMVERRLLEAATGDPVGRIVYPWSETGIVTSRSFSRLGIKVVREKTNCGKFAARSILDEAYDAIGEEAEHGITDALIEKEAEELSLADAIFCPSPMVKKTLLDVGVPGQKCIDTSYGWEPERFNNNGAVAQLGSKPVFLFVGYLCVNKGVHILLQAWEKANIDAKLVLVGHVESTIEKKFAHLLERPDIQHVSYTRDLAAYYRAADWFVFPSLAEGGPQVTYEAGGLGVPSIVSRMGAGAFTRHGQDGLIIEQYTVDAWAEALVTAISTEEDIRLTMAESARKRAQNFTWQRVGEQRTKALLERFGKC